MNLSKYFERLVNLYREDDPAFCCAVFIDSGCSHIDGMLCDFETCSIRLDYLSQQEDKEAENSTSTNKPRPKPVGVGHWSDVVCSLRINNNKE